MRLCSWRSAGPAIAARRAAHGDAVRSLVLNERDGLARLGGEIRSGPVERGPARDRLLLPTRSSQSNSSRGLFPRGQAVSQAGSRHSK